jgi:GNAT superfamily N-acetyltransferase
MHQALLATHWGKDIPRDIFARAVANSLCIGVYTSADEQIGLVRVISDYATFAYYCDVYILEPHRRKGLAHAAMRAAETHPKLQLLRRQHLVTPDMQALYARFGFIPVEQPGWHMEKRDPEIYQRLAKTAKR